MEYEVATSSSEDTPFDVKSFALDVIGGDMASPSDDIQTRIYDDTQVLVQRVQDLMSKHVDNRELVAEIEALKRLNEASEQTMGRYRVMGANASTATLTAVPVSATASRYKSLNERLDSNCEQFPDIADVTVEENAKLARILDELEASVRGVAIAGEHRRRGATAIERQQDAKEALQIAVATFQRNVYDIEKLICKCGSCSLQKGRAKSNDELTPSHSAP